MTIVKSISEAPVLVGCKRTNANHVSILAFCVFANAYATFLQRARHLAHMSGI